MNFPLGKEHLAELALVQVVGKFLVAHAEAHAIGFVSEGALGDHAVSGALQEKRHEVGGTFPWNCWRPIMRARWQPVAG